MDKEGEAALEVLTSDEAKEREKKLAEIRGQIGEKMVAGQPYDTHVEEYRSLAFYKRQERS